MHVSLLTAKEVVWVAEGWSQWGVWCTTDVSETSCMTSPIASQRTKNFPTSRYLLQVSWYVKHKCSSRWLPLWVQHKHVWTLEPPFILELFWPTLEDIWNKPEVSTWQSAEKEKELWFQLTFQNPASLMMQFRSVSAWAKLLVATLWWYSAEVLVGISALFVLFLHCFTHSVKSARDSQPQTHHPRQDLTVNHSREGDLPVFHLVF